MSKNSELMKSDFKTLIRIDAPHYCAGIVIHKGVVIKAAPILFWTVDKSEKYVLNYFKRKRFKVEFICNI